MFVSLSWWKWVPSRPHEHQRLRCRGHRPLTPDIGYTGEIFAARCIRYKRSLLYCTFLQVATVLKVGFSLGLAVAFFLTIGRITSFISLLARLFSLLSFLELSVPDFFKIDLWRTYSRTNTIRERLRPARHKMKINIKWTSDNDWSSLSVGIVHQDGSFAHALTSLFIFAVIPVATSHAIAVSNSSYIKIF